MDETPEAYLRRLFETDRADPEFFTKNPPDYKFHSRLGAKPWWPPLAVVWHSGEKCPERRSGRTGWADAWALLQSLHEQYQVQTSRNKVGDLPP